MSKPTISVVIPTLNEEQQIGEILSNLAEQTYPIEEIIVADAGSVDKTVEIAKNAGARIIKGARPAYGRTEGAKEAKSDWVFFFDADTRVPSNSWFEDALNSILEQQIVAAVANYRPYYRPGDRGHDSSVIQLWDKLVISILTSSQRTWLKMGFPIGLAVFMAVKRDVFLSLNGFDSSVEPYEDSEYLLRVHRQIEAPANGTSAVGILHPSLFVWHSMRRYDVKGRLFWPISTGIRGSFMRWFFNREFPDKEYFDLNEGGYPEHEGLEKRSKNEPL